MNKQLTEMVLILDRSGSMHRLEADTIGGFNSTIEKQKKVDGKAFVTTVLFDDVSEVIHDRVDLQQVKPITSNEYFVRGCTALLDAVGSTINHITGIHRYARPEDVPAHTIVVITTDGYENASRKFTRDQVKAMIAEQEKAGWEFVFLGANIDAVEAAGEIGICPQRAATYLADSEGTDAAWSCIFNIFSRTRAAEPFSPSWKAKVEEDTAERK